MTDDILFSESHRLANDILEIRDRLKPIVFGEIQRGHCLAGNAEAYGGTRGNRKTTLKDAREIARHAIARIDQITSRFYDAT
jgi:hypothetical protein